MAHINFGGTTFMGEVIPVQGEWVAVQYLDDDNGDFEGLSYLPVAFFGVVEDEWGQTSIEPIVWEDFDFLRVSSLYNFLTLTRRDCLTEDKINMLERQGMFYCSQNN